jgi:hypothetical protein
MRFALFALGPGSRSASLHSPGTRERGRTIDLVSRMSERKRAKIRDPGPNDDPLLIRRHIFASMIEGR